MSKFIDLACWVLILTIFINGELLEGRAVSNVVDRSIVKTIKAGKNEIIDCYDIYRQPSLNHPLLYNHTIQMTPSSYPKGMKSNNFGTLQLTQTWQKYGSCPQGSIPIRRKGKDHLLHNYRHPKSSPHKITNALQPNLIPAQIHEYASISVHGNLLGAQAKINLWRPVLEIPAEFSISQIWVIGARENIFDTVEAGWIVGRGDNLTRFFIYFTADGYGSTGCYNLNCDGFVQTSSSIAPDCSFTELSTFKGSQKDATFGIHKDQSSGNWWVQIQGTQVGYYPSSLFKQLSNMATTVSWGGEITNWKDQRRHTKTQMGSGHLPSEGHLGTSSYFNWVQLFDQNNTAKNPENIEKLITNPTCYDLEIDDTHLDTNGYGFYYGGPGYSDKCQ
ncbi:hypothetical protein C5167_040993 [Papaver somniferum]|uniref:Neprosin PEP catalytic domain-containing protein n=1 Tax=Papaver somniferum TaxID=3469 RepID=A0A4Y7IKU2_PAPSO|nr:uncharacterized protein LOC113339368 [Papaver somniferum]RZC48068.1 hypothetical protein C5167_040993 [Papaver somniferum]